MRIQNDEGRDFLDRVPKLEGSNARLLKIGNRKPRHAQVVFPPFVLGALMLRDANVVAQECFIASVKACKYDCELTFGLFCNEFFQLSCEVATRRSPVAADVNAVELSLDSVQVSGYRAKLDLGANNIFQSGFTSDQLL